MMAKCRAERDGKKRRAETVEVARVGHEAAARKCDN